MSTELEKLLDEASADPTTPLDPDALWADGRRRRWGRRAGVAGGTAVLVLAVTLAGMNLATPGTPDIAPLGQETTAPAETTETTEPDDGVDTAAAADEEARAARRAARQAALERLDAVRERLAREQEAREAAELAAMEEERAAIEQEQAAREAQEAQEAAEEERQTAEAAQPDPARVAAPCAGHEGRTGEAFLEVAAPVDGQRVGSSIELVGCSNVYEATVRYRLVGSGGTVDSFTTATCGSGCVGEFRETITVPAGSGPLTLEVFWDSPKDGSEVDKVTRTLARS